MEQVALGEVRLRYDGRGLIPVIVQQVGTGEVLMVAWANEEALRLTLATDTSYSRLCKTSNACTALRFGWS